MAERYDRIEKIVRDHAPCSVRHAFYRAVVECVPGVTKDAAGYQKVQRAVLDLRESGRLPWHLIVDSTRWMRLPETFDGVEDALNSTAQIYRRNLWTDSPWRVEVWCESDSIAGTVADITFRWTVALAPCRGQAGAGFAHNAVELWATTPHRQPVVLYIGDHDPAGLEIEKCLRCRLEQFAAGTFEAIRWQRLGVTWNQVEEFDLPGTKPKKRYGFDRSVEAEALPAQLLRSIVNDAIADYVDRDQLDVLRVAEAEERELLVRLAAGEVLP